MLGLSRVWEAASDGRHVRGIVELGTFAWWNTVRGFRASLGVARSSHSVSERAAERGRVVTAQRQPAPSAPSR